MYLKFFCGDRSKTQINGVPMPSKKFRLFDHCPQKVQKGIFYYNPVSFPVDDGTWKHSTTPKISDTWVLGISHSF